MSRRMLFSVTRKDLIIQTFRSGGPGGQHQNKTDSGVRIVHKDSGAVGESRTHRSQQQNRKEAFRRLVASKEFKGWHRRRVADLLVDQAAVEAAVDDAMRADRIKVEVWDGDKADWKAE